MNPYLIGAGAALLTKLLTDSKEEPKKEDKKADPVIKPEQPSVSDLQGHIASLTDQNEHLRTTNAHLVREIQKYEEIIEELEAELEKIKKFELEEKSKAELPEEKGTKKDETQCKSEKAGDSGPGEKSGSGSEETGSGSSSKKEEKRSSQKSSSDQEGQQGQKGSSSKK